MSDHGIHTLRNRQLMPISKGNYPILTCQPRADQLRLLGSTMSLGQANNNLVSSTELLVHNHLL